ncbi:MAG: type II toxin-antitoxin system VapC family toxin [Chloroflexi bacterium]|nr:type II toxin-antitoxin system VapC family toxin [Chloroflexota bacterium]
MTSYLVDTDWIIDHLNRKPEVRERLRELRGAGIGMSVISLAELYEGVYYSKDPAKSERMLETLLKQFAVLGVDTETCQIFGKERDRLRQIKEMVSDFDLMIAATCIRRNLTLLTNNRRHFQGIARLKIISTSKRAN